MTTDRNSRLDAMNNWLERYHRSSWPVILMASAYAAAVGVLYRGLQGTIR